MGTYMFWGSKQQRMVGSEIKFFMDGDRVSHLRNRTEDYFCDMFLVTEVDGATGRTVPHMQVRLRSPIRTVPTKPSRDSACTAGISDPVYLMRI